MTPQPRTTRLWRRAVALLNAEEDATPLALTRMALGATLCVHLVRTLVSGSAAVVWTHTTQGGLSGHPWSATLGVGGVLALVAATAACAAAVALGWRTRATLVGAWLGLRLLLSFNGVARGGFDVLMVNTLFLLLLSGCANAWSLDAGRRGVLPALRFARLLCAFQLSVMYLGSASTKLSWTWIPGGEGSALWYSLHMPLWARFPDALPLWAFPVTQLFTWAVWLFELSAPLLFIAVVMEAQASTSRLARALRRVRFISLFLLFGVGMHVGIELLMHVGPFSAAALALYPCAAGPHRIGTVGAWLRGAWVRVARRDPAKL